MAYSSDSFSAGEQPTTAKWNKLWSNDASFNDGTGIANLSLSTTSLSNPYKFRVYRSAALTATSATYTKLVYDAETFDTNNNFATGTYTAPVTGYYSFSGKFRCDLSNIVGIFLYKNGVQISEGNTFQYTANLMGATITDLMSVTAGDTIEIYYYINGAVALVVGSVFTYFSGYLVSRT